jgi:hypothetical protein
LISNNSFLFSNCPCFIIAVFLLLYNLCFIQVAFFGPSVSVTKLVLGAVLSSLSAKIVCC